MYNNFDPHYDNDEMFPEVYKKLMPVVDQVVSDMEKQYGNITVTGEVLNSMTEEVLRRAGMGNKQQLRNDDAIPTINYGGNYGHWGHHNRDTLNDLARILIWSQIFGLPRRHRWKWYR